MLDGTVRKHQHCHVSTKERAKARSAAITLAGLDIGPLPSRLHQPAERP